MKMQGLRIEILENYFRAVHNAFYRVSETFTMGDVAIALRQDMTEMGSCLSIAYVW